MTRAEYVWALIQAAAELNMDQLNLEAVTVELAKEHAERWGIFAPNDRESLARNPIIGALLFISSPQSGTQDIRTLSMIYWVDKAWEFYNEKTRPRVRAGEVL